MRHHLISTTTTVMPPRKAPQCPHSCRESSPSSSPSLCKHHHSPSATLDLLILILVLFAAAFLIISYFSYIFHSISLLLPPPPPSLSLSSILAVGLSHLRAQPVFYASLIFSAVSVIALLEICCGARSRRCNRPNCKGLKKAMEFDLQLQGEECLKASAKSHKAVRDVDELPWKGGSEGNPDYECLRAELRKMAPPNGRAVLLFRAKCGCPVAKLEGWGPKRGRRQKKNLALSNGSDHR